ncbi:hypothetical protein B0H14DRAFT_2584925 [Mycena olivaceomarginata]|nr:hypothetical protein B0H14DRAFT_2584925 [Mycena olivaceomarginata]
MNIAHSTVCFVISSIVSSRRLIFWHIDGEVPTLVAFQVRNKDLDPGPPAGHVVVSAERYERATEALWQREQGRAKSIAKSKAEKQAREPAFKNVTSPEKRAALAAKMGAMEEAYRARVGASRASSTAPTLNGMDV